MCCCSFIACMWNGMIQSEGDGLRHQPHLGESGPIKKVRCSNRSEFSDSSSANITFSSLSQTSTLVCCWALAFQTFIYTARRWVTALYKARTFGAGLKNSNESFFFFSLFLYLSSSVPPFCWAQLKPCPLVLTKSFNWIKSFTWMKRGEGREQTEEGRARDGAESKSDKYCVCKENKEREQWQVKNTKSAEGERKCL